MSSCPLFRWFASEAVLHAQYQRRGASELALRGHVQRFVRIGSNEGQATAQPIAKVFAQRDGIVGV